MREAYMYPPVDTLAIVNRSYWGPIRNKGRADLAVEHVKALYKQGKLFGVFNLVQ